LLPSSKCNLHPPAWRVRENSSRRPLFCLLVFAAFFLTLSPCSFAQDAPNAPQPKPSPYAQAESLLQNGKPEEALKLLSALSAKESNAHGLELLLGKAYFQSKKYPEAIAHLIAALESSPNDPESTQLLAITYYASGNYEQAAMLLEKLGPQLPKGNADGPYLLGTCYIQLQRWDDARKTFAQMFSVSPDSAMAYLMFGKILIRRRREEQATPQIQKALELDPRLPMAHFLLGELDLYQKNPQAAVNELQQELAINPTIWLVYWRLGDAYVRLEKYDEAEKILKEAIWLNEASSGAYILLGQISLKKGESGIAAGFLERALKLDPQNFWVHYFLAKAYHNLGRTAEANQQFEISKSMRDDQINDDRKMLQAAP
jgi:tetratricopeptide (TPR) repeat protein